MSHYATKPISNIAVAFATQSPSIDIKTRDAGHLGTNSAPSKQHDMLPTPPNSISPTLPPHKLRSPQHVGSAPTHLVDSDIDLQDAVDHAASLGHPQALSSAALHGLESAGAITPTMLAKDHLPEFLLINGPLAIRHILGHLTQTVPGFSRIPPAKARRIVVAALESRGGGGENGDVLYEKVGWGRWDARIRGQPPREGQVPSSGMHESHLAASPTASLVGSYASNAGGLQIPHGRYRGSRGDAYGRSWTADSMISSREDEMMDDLNMAEHEADKMSLDGIEEISVSSHAGPEDMVIEENSDDVTDEEDWAGIGAQALRAANAPRKDAKIDYNYLSYHASRMKHSNQLAKPPPTRRAASFAHSSKARSGISYPGGIVPPRIYSSSAVHNGRSVSSMPFNDRQHHATKEASPEEREAIAALLAMGASM